MNNLYRKPSVSLHYLNIIQNALARMGHSSQSLQALLVDKTEDEYYFNRAPIEVLTEAWKEAAKLAKDPLIALHVGERIHPMDYGLLGQMLMNSNTIAEAIENVFSVEFIINNMFPTEIIVEDGQAISRLYCHHYSPEFIADVVEQDISGMINLGVFIMNKDYTEQNRPLEVHFRHQPQGPVEEYERALRCKVKFGQNCNQVIYPDSILTVPTYNPSPRIANILKNEIQMLLQQVEELDSMSLRVWRYFQSCNQSNSIDIQSAAKHFNMTTRTLQRHLKAEGTSFQEELNSFKGDIAKQLLQNSTQAITQVAHTMGFNDSSAFHKAFKRWTGITPGEYQRSIA